MKRLLDMFFRYLEKFSVFLEHMAARRQKRYAYFFCGLRIMIGVIAILMAAAMLILNFQKLPSLTIQLLAILALVLCVILLGAYIRVIITQDMKQIQRKDPKANEDPARKNKIEF